MDNNLIGVFTDQHLRSTGSFPPFNRLSQNGLTRELNNILFGFNFMADQIRKYRPRAVFSLGDIFHNPETIEVPTLHGAALGLGAVRDACAEVGCKLYILEGNHDINSEAPTRISSVSVLQGFGEVVTEMTAIDIDEFTICLVPFHSNSGKMYSLLQEGQLGADLLMTHIDVAGCKYENNHHSESDLDPEFNIPVISGDIHLRQEVGKVIYPGSLVQQRFSRYDLDGIGGALFYDLATKEQIFEPNTYSKHYVKVKDLEVAKKLDKDRVVLQVLVDATAEEVEKELEGYEYIKLPVPKLDDGIETEYDNPGIESPELILRNFISTDKPEALNEFDNILKTKKEEIANA